MINVIIKRNYRLDAYAISITGHAEYDDFGKDIICAGVSALAINMANSIEEFTNNKFVCDIDENNGDFSFALKDDYDDKAMLLIDSCILGIRQIQQQYGEKFIKITDQEV